MPQIGFVGLGVIGSRMAAHLLQSGERLSVYNRTPERTAPLVQLGAVRATSLRDLAASCDVIFTCVSRTEDVQSVLTEMAPFASPNTLFVDHSTIAPAAAKSLHDQLTANGLRFMDAPVTGGEKGAIEGTLTVFCGGNESDFLRAEPFIRTYARTARLVGPSGSGQMMKMANQISVALCVLATCECLVFCEKAGLDLKESVDLIGDGAGSSWSLINYGPKIAQRDWSPGFSVALQQKDLAYALQTARDLGVALPGTALTHQLFAALENQGRGNQATPALFEIIEELSGGKR